MLHKKRLKEKWKKNVYIYINFSVIRKQIKLKVEHKMTNNNKEIYIDKNILSFQTLSAVFKLMISNPNVSKDPNAVSTKL